jgi:hypothetical protein
MRRAIAVAAACTLAAACSANMKPRPGGAGTYKTGRIGQSLSAAAQTDPARLRQMQEQLRGRSGAGRAEARQPARGGASTSPAPASADAPPLLAGVAPEARTTVFESRALQMQTFLGPQAVAAGAGAPLAAAPVASPAPPLRAAQAASPRPGAPARVATAPRLPEFAQGPLPWVLGLLAALALALVGVLLMRRRSQQRQLLDARPEPEVELVRERHWPPVAGDQERPNLPEPAADAPYVFQTQHLIPPSREELVHALHAQSRDAEQLLTGRAVDVEGEEVAAAQGPGELGVDDRVQHSLFPAGEDLGSAEAVKPHQPVGLVKSVFAQKWGGDDRQPGR